MGRSHAKSNTKQANLTYYERSLLRKEGAARRIGQDSMKPLDACNLCLVRVVDGVACPSAHIYCRECAYSDLLAQRSGIAAQRAEMEAWAADDVRRAAEARAKARERVVADFERGMGFAARKTATTSTGARDSKRETTAGSASASASASASDSKIIREDEIERIALQAEESALAAIEAEAGEARKAKLAAFWLPSLTPEAPLGPLAAVKLQTLCHVGGRPHPYTAKNLRPVVFTYPPGSKEKEGKPTCPSCTKELTNASGAVLLASRVSAPAPTENGDRDEPARKKSKKDKKKDKDTVAVCGHVVCRACANTLVRPAHRCCVCEASVEDKDILELGKEGTGFAAAGYAESKRDVVTFRV